MNRIYIKIVLAVLLLLCLFNMPYGYYTLVRFVVSIAFAIMAYKSYVSKETEWCIVYVAIAILFQPIFKIPLGRVMWNIVDVLVAILLFLPMLLNHFLRRD